MTNITIHADKPGAKINPSMWGIFFEDINLGADGGLYAELVKNGSFEFPDPLMGWFKISPSLARGELEVRTESACNAANPHCLRIRSHAAAPFGICNEGHRGMGLRVGETYDFSAWLRGVDGKPRVTVEIVGSDGTTLDAAPVPGIGPEWAQLKVTLRPKDTDAKARLTVILEGAGAVDIDRVSLFPHNTWKRRAGGLRADMVQLLADLKPGFLRFPGGCIVEGSDLSKRYQWKNTILPLAERQLTINRWNYEFKHRPTPDYYQSFGLGFFEFFQLSEDIGAEPMPILNCGMACQFNSGELAPMDQLDTYVQDALDLIEFANGPASSPWGAKRAAMGHPKPFNMRLLGIGNEQWGPQYIERLAVFIKVLKSRHPEIELIAACGPLPQDDRFHYLWPRLRELKADIIDEHCYAPPPWFLCNANRYDEYDRNGPKVFFGEYAAQSVAMVSTKNRNNLECALAEAAFMTGLERNADVVCMASYAPLFAHADGWQWTPDLIWTDNLRAYATPNYYVQQLFSRNRGDVVLPVTIDTPVQEILLAGRIGVGTVQCAAEFKDVRVTRAGETLFESSPATSAEGWVSEDARWCMKDGTHQQPDPKATCTTSAGEATWTDYTLTLKARRLAGAGSLVIMVLEGAGSHARWILGGSGNREHAIQIHFAQQDRLVNTKSGSLEDGRWYELKIVLTRTTMECHLDGQLVQRAEIPVHRVQQVYASAVHEEETGQVILKLVNPGEAVRKVQINLSGVSGMKPEGKVTVLTGGDLSDINTFDQPCNVVPVESVIRLEGSGFDHTLLPRSMAVLRVKPEER